MRRSIVSRRNLELKKVVSHGKTPTTYDSQHTVSHQPAHIHNGGQTSLRNHRHNQHGPVSDNSTAHIPHTIHTEQDSSPPIYDSWDALRNDTIHFLSTTLSTRLGPSLFGFFLSLIPHGFRATWRDGWMPFFIHHGMTTTTTPYDYFVSFFFFRKRVGWCEEMGMTGRQAARWLWLVGWLV